MSLYRWFKTQVYWLIPDSFKSTNTDEFDSDTDLVTIFKTTDQDQVYENRNVTLSQLSDLINGGGGAYKELFLTTSYLGTANIGYNTFTATGFPISHPSTGVWTITFNNVADRPTSDNKIQVIADVSGGYGIAEEIWRVSVYSTAQINGVVTINLYKCNPSTGVWALANPVPGPHPVYIRVYN